ncbi:hypothetical protein D3C80_1656400 [compost metagenome]
MGDIERAFIEGARGTQLIEDSGESREGGFELANARQVDLSTVLLGNDRLLQLCLLGRHARRDHFFQVNTRPGTRRGYRHHTLLSICLKEAKPGHQITSRKD